MSAAGRPLEGRVVLVTGAGNGVGRGVCLAAAEAGASVVVTSPRENGEETLAMIEAAGGTATWVRCDVTSRDDVAAAIAHAVERFGGLDGVVHNATSRRSSEVHAIEDVDLGLFREHAAVSLRGAYYFATLAFPHLRERRGRYVLFTSPAGMEGSSTLSLYGVVKAGLRTFTKSLAAEWGRHGINVTCMSVLAVTPALANAYRENPELEARLNKLVPLGRVGDAATDIGPAAVFLLSDAASYVTGQTIVVDGGRFTGL